MINTCPKHGAEAGQKKIIPSTTGPARKIHAQAGNAQAALPCPAQKKIIPNTIIFSLPGRISGPGFGPGFGLLWISCVPCKPVTNALINFGYTFIFHLFLFVLHPSCSKWNVIKSCSCHTLHYFWIKIMHPMKLFETRLVVHHLLIMDIECKVKIFKMVNYCSSCEDFSF